MLSVVLIFVVMLEMEIWPNFHRCSTISVEQVEKFELVFEGRTSDILLEGKGSSTLVVAAHRELKVYTVKGELICSFKDHTEPICSICVVCFSLLLCVWTTDNSNYALEFIYWSSKLYTYIFSH